MTGNCALCPAKGVEVASTYKETALGADLCSCCQIKVFNLLRKSHCPPEHVDLALRFARMMPTERRQPPARERRLRSVRPVFVPSDWCAHSVPPSDL